MYLPQFLEKRLSFVVKWGLFLLLPLPLYVSSSMLFPFITGRNFGFRIIIELLVIGWVGLLFLSREYRPQLTWLTRSILVFLFIVTLADILGPNPYRSFWSNYERMEGLIALIHMVVFYLMIISVLRRFKDWQYFLYGSTAISIIVSFIALSQKLGFTRVYQGGEGRSIRVDGAIGNPAYLASYMAFHVFFMLFFIWREKQAWIRWVMASVVIFELYIIYLTATRGVILAMIAVVGLLAILFAIRKAQDQREMILRRTAIGVLAVSVILIGAFFALKDTDLVKKNSILVRFSSISIGERTVQSRFFIWNMAWQGVKERPILGWGQENFYLVFNKYFNPKLWGSEPWFDRSHNVFLDWLIHTGFPGLAVYLAILFFGLKNIWLSFKKKTISYYEAGILGGLFGIYFFQNLFVFDNFQSYFLLFMTLGFSDYLSRAGDAPEPREAPNFKKNAGAVYGAIGAAAVIMIFVLYFANLKPIFASQDLIQALGMAGSPKVPLPEIQTQFEKVISYDTFGSGEAREQLASIARSIFLTPNRASPEDMKKFVDFTIAEVKALTEGPAVDVKHLLFLGSIYNTASSLDASYHGPAVDVLERAVAISPTKQPLYFELATAELGLGHADLAVKAMEKAVLLDPTFPTAHLNAALIAAVGGVNAVAAKEIEEFRKLNPVPEANSRDRVIDVYVRLGDFKSIKTWIEDSIKLEPANAELYGRYAAVLATLGEKEAAKAAARKAGELNPELKPAVDQFIKEIDAGLSPGG